MTRASLPVIAMLLVAAACTSPAPAGRDEGPDGGGRDAIDLPSDLAPDAISDPAIDVAPPDPGTGDGPAFDDAPVADPGLDVPPPADLPADPGPDAAPPADLAADASADLAGDLATDPGPGVPPCTRASMKAALASGDSAAVESLRSRCDGPICDDAACLVVSTVPGTSVTLRGDFNGWTDTAMAPVAAVADTWWAEVAPVPAAADYWAYKLHVDGAWRTDPSNRWIRFSDIAIDSAAYRPGVPRLAALQAVHSTELANDRDVYVYVPAEAFEDRARRFPVMYLQDGWNVFDNPQAPFGSWHVDRTARELAAAGAIEPVILVGIATADRYDEYLYTDIFVSGSGVEMQVTPKLAAYAEFLVGTIKPAIDAAFPTRPGRADTAMGGSSLGGLSSFWIGWNHPDVFGSVAALSPSFWVGEDGSGTEGHPSMRSLVLASTPTALQRSLRIYLDSGDQGYSPGGAGDPAYAIDGRAYTDWMRNALVGLGWPNRSEWDDDGNLATPPADLPLTVDPTQVKGLAWSATVPPAYASWDAYLRPDLALLDLVGLGHPHNEAAWEQRFPAVLRFLFPAR